MNFQNITLLGKGTTRKATGPINRDAGFDLRFTNYTRTGKNGAETVNQFVFTKVGLAKTGLSAAEVAAAPFYDGDNSVVGIAVVPAEQGVFLCPAKRSKNGKKSAVVTVPSLAAALAAEGMLNTEFEGSQHFELALIGESDGVKYFQITKSTTIADRAYEPGDEKEAGEEAGQDEVANHSGY